MRPEELKNSFDKIAPNEVTKKRMLDHIIAFHKNKKKNKKYSQILFKAIPAVAMVLVVTASLLAFFNLNKDNASIIENTGDRMIQDDKMTEEHTADLSTEPLNQFKIEDKTYNILRDSDRSDYGFSETIAQKDIGKRITSIKSNAAPELIGCAVYQYLPANGDAVVAVKKDNGYILYKFYGFDSYMNNQDEDAEAYLKLYGIRKVNDIAKIMIIDQSNNHSITLTDRSQIQKFYDNYSVLKNASDKYFEKLYSYKNESNLASATQPNAIPPDYPDQAQDEIPIADIAVDNIAQPKAAERIRTAEDLTPKAHDTPQTTVQYDTGNAGSSSGSAGISNDIFGNHVLIRIYNQGSIYFETVYYPNFGFISRYEISKEFANLLDVFIR